MTAELLYASVKTAVAEYAPFYLQLAELEQENSCLVFNYEDKKGNKEARSHINTLRLTKGALERTRKDAKAESLRIGRAIDSEAASIAVRIEAMINVHQDAIDEIEKREADRVASIRSRLDTLSAIHHGKTVDEYRRHIANIEAVVINNSWQEFISDAAKAKDYSLVEHSRLLSDREKADADAAELERLRVEQAARAQKDRDDSIAKAAEDRAKAELEAKSKQEREDAERRELSLKLAAENSERRRIEAEQKAKQAALDAKIHAEQSRLKAIQDETDRIAAMAKAEADALAVREADIEHRRTINRTAVAAFIEGGMDAREAEIAITLIAKRLIPAISISY